VDVFVSGEMKTMSSRGSFSDFVNNVGRTPMLELKTVNRTGSRIFAKMDSENPSGSIKDVMAYYMVKSAEERGELRPGMDILEVTTGNTGISLALIAKLKGYGFTAVMPEHMSIERRHIMEGYGARIILTPREEDMPGAMKRYEELKKAMPDAWLPKQFENRDNVSAHREITGREVAESMNGRKVDAFVAGVGTGGTLMGVALALRELNPDVRIIAVEPAESAVMTGGKPGLHNIQGIGEGFVPPLVDMKAIDEVIAVRAKDAMRMAGRLYEKERIFAGISSGANVLASLEVAKKMGKGKNVVTVIPDSGNRYISMGIFNNKAKNKRGG
jgi:cysteine synthase A